MCELIQRAKELRPLMMSEHLPTVDRLIEYLQEGSGDMADQKELADIVGVYELYKTPAIIKMRLHRNLIN